MSETHKVYNVNDFSIPGFCMFFNESSLNKCDGCVIYVKQEYHINHQVLVEKDLRVIKITVQKKQNVVDVLATYRCFASTKEEFVENLDTILQHQNKDKNRLQVFVGDINIDILATEADITNLYITMMQSNGFVSMINKATRVSGESQTCLDHYFVKCSDSLFKQVNAVILRHKMTDHDPILLNIQFQAMSSKTTDNKKNYQILNHDELAKRMNDTEWDDVLQQSDTNLCTSIFINKLKGIIVDSSKSINISCKKQRLKPWITKGILESIRNRDRLKKQCTLNHNNIVLINRYKEFRKSLSKIIKRSKYTYFKSLAENNANDPKKLWKVIKEATNDQVTKLDINCIMDGDGIEINDRRKIASEFNNFFINIGKKLAARITTTNSNSNMNSRTLNSFLLNPITQNEIIRAINSLKQGVKGGEDCICSDIIKQYKYKLLGPLNHIINMVFATGVFPDILKNSIIIPLFKTGDKRSTNNYRPIALTSTISKIIEKCLKTRMIKFFEKYNLLNNNQFAFRDGSNTENALCRVTECILKNLDQGNKTIGVFLDLQKAFDTVEHRILLRRLEVMGVRGTPNNLIKSYLRQRHQCVRIVDEKSDSAEVEFGVPQGTVLSPLLFNVYIDGILSVLGNEGMVFCFADDTAILISGETWDLARRGAEVALRKIKIWLDDSLLSLNIEKTKFVAFSLSPRSLPCFEALRLHEAKCEVDIKCNCQKIIERNSSIKYLGVIIDETFSWKEQVNFVTQRIRKVIFKFYELRNVLPLKTLKMVYFALVESIINYGLVVWGSAGKTVMAKLQVAQKWVIKIMLFKKKRYPTELVYKDSNLLSPNQMYIKSIIRFMLKNNYYKDCVNHGKNTRNAVQNNLILQKPRYAVCQNHIYCLGPKVFNELPVEIRTKPYHKVGREITKWLIESNYTIRYVI